jgi:hypothetical protein
MSALLGILLIFKQRRIAMVKLTKINTTAFISPKNLAERWQCSRSSVDRYATQAGLRKLILGTGKNACVRYFLDDVESFEKKRTV